MKKMMCVGGLLLTAVAGFAQESRQDVSLSATGTFSPFVNGTGGIKEKTDPFVGFLGSYRYMLTPRSAVEANYSFTQYKTHLSSSFLAFPVTTRQQEFSLAYVYSHNFRNFNPFVEAGPAALFFSPILDYTTGSLDAKRTTGIAALFGGGLAYEISPSFDIRAEYRAFAVKPPNFGLDAFNTHRYTVYSMPSIGIAYHF